MTEQTSVITEEKTAVIEKTPAERVNAALENVKSFFVQQAKRYEDNPRRAELLSSINERLAGISVSEDRAKELVEESKKFTGQRSVKWNQEMLNFTNAKGYAASELRDKVNEMNPGLPKLVYEAVLKVVESWDDAAIPLPCPMVNCRCNSFVKTEKGVDGLFRTACTNPKHFRIETPEGAETEAGSIDNWNKLIQNN